MTDSLDTLQAELVQLRQERDAALQREAAMADIARRINEAPLDLDGTLLALCEAARELTDGDSARMWLLEGDTLVAGPGSGGEMLRVIEDLGVFFPLSSPSPIAAAVRERRGMSSVDIQADLTAPLVPGEAETPAGLFDLLIRIGVRSLICAPLGRIAPLGGLSVYRREIRPFSAGELATLEAFATQAAVAIETARAQRLLVERSEALANGLERETATAEILRTISASPGELEGVLAGIGNAAMRLCEADHCAVNFTDTDGVTRVWDPVRGFRVFEAAGRTSWRIMEMETEGDQGFDTFSGPIDSWAERYPGAAELSRREGLAEASFVRVKVVAAAGTPVWLIVRRSNARAFETEHIALLQRFADQALIAIENARVFTELQQRNRDVSVALGQQKALSDVLNVIANSATDAKPVLEAILETGSRLCMADGASAVIVKGDQLHAEATTGLLIALTRDDRATWPMDRHSASGQAILDRRVVQIEAYREREYRQYRSVASLVEDYGIRTAIAVPLLRGEDALGALAFARMNDEPFTPQQVALIETFASQAVIAIENARMFNELQARNREISESLRREEAGSEILGLISSSPEELDVTLQAIADAASRLTGMSANLSLLDGEFRVVRGHARVDSVPLFQKGERLPLTQTLRHVVDTRQPLSWQSRDTSPVQENWLERGLTAVAIVPIVQNEVVLGFLGLASVSAEAIPASAITLLQSFADQAAIAIENARLIRELRESNRAISENLDIQRVMGEVLSIVASAPTDLAMTLPKIAKAAAQLCDADVGGGVLWVDGDALVSCASILEDLVTVPYTREGPVRTTGHRAIRESRVVEWQGSIEKMRDAYPYQATIAPHVPETSLLSIPMFSASGTLGAITVIRSGLQGFPERSRSILAALATQAVVAIENSRLFNQLQTKSQELEVASRHKSEFLANMSHELRTPLNAIIGYAELLQEECEDLGSTDFLPDLGKIHSAGKHLLTLISGILDLSKVEAGRMTMFLEDFDVATLIKDADAIVRPLVEKNRNTFVIECPQGIGPMHADLVKVRQVLFNLLSNSAKFTEGGTITLSVVKEPSEDTIRFAIRDTGIGMTEEQLGRLFEAFSQANAETSRKYGGTGLGLALSREFCRMMGGDIAVTSEIGRGSTFTVTLPVSCVDSESSR